MITLHSELENVFEEAKMQFIKHILDVKLLGAIFEIHILFYVVVKQEYMI